MLSIANEKAVLGVQSVKTLESDLLKKPHSVKKVPLTDSGAYSARKKKMMVNALARRELRRAPEFFKKDFSSRDDRPRVFKNSQSLEKRPLGNTSHKNLVKA